MLLLSFAVVWSVSLAKIRFNERTFFGPAGSLFNVNRFLSFGHQEFSDVNMTMQVVVDIPTAMAFCTGNLTLLRPLEGKLVALLYPTHFPAPGSNQLDVSLGGASCLWETMFANGQRAKVAGVVVFNDGLLTDVILCMWFMCRNCSVFTGERFDFPCLRLLGTENVTVPIIAAFYGNLLFGRNFTLPPQSLFPPFNVTLLGPDLSRMERLQISVGYLFQVVFALWSATLTTLAIAYIVVKLRKSRTRSKEQYFPFVGVAALAFEAVCNLWRFTIVVVDPFNSRGIYPASYLATVNGQYAWSISFAASWIVTCYWFRITVLNRQRNAAVGVPTVVFMVLGIALVIVAEFTVKGYFLTIDIVTFVRATFISTFVAHVLVGIFFCLSGFFVLKIMRDAQKASVNKDGLWKRDTARYIVGSGILFFMVAALSVVLIACYRIPVWNINLCYAIGLPEVMFGVFIAACLLMLSISTLQILVFRERLCPCGDTRELGSISTSTGSTDSPLDVQFEQTATSLQKK